MRSVRCDDAATLRMDERGRQKRSLLEEDDEEKQLLPLLPPLLSTPLLSSSSSASDTSAPRPLSRRSVEPTETNASRVSVRNKMLARLSGTKSTNRSAAPTAGAVDIAGVEDDDTIVARHRVAVAAASRGIRPADDDDDEDDNDAADEAGCQSAGGAITLRAHSST